MYEEKIRCRQYIDAIGDGRQKGSCFPVEIHSDS